MPGDDFFSGWQKSGQIHKFSQEDLYGHINGGAELFLEFGFDTLFIQHYMKDDQELTLELYQMETNQSAMGIYLMKCGKENPATEIASHHTMNRYQLTMVKDKYFIQINNFSGDELHLPAITSLANSTLSRIPENLSLAIFDWLPTENRIQGSELIVRGPYGLQSIYTFGEDDILGLGGKTYAFIADYETADQGLFTWIKIVYENNEVAGKIFLNLKNNLDPLMTIISNEENSFVFMDYAKEYSSVEHNANFLLIKIHLKKAPVE